MEKFYSEIKNNLIVAISELDEVAKLEKGDILVVGCSTSEVIGEKIGSSGNIDVAKIIFETLNEFCKSKGVYLAAQCCEHLNRAIVIENALYLSKRDFLTKVCVVPQIHAGGSFAHTAYFGFENPCVVENIKAQAGIDIGNTLIGMHLSAVAVPVRVSVKTVGEAPLVLARTRPKYIGGERAKYE